ncbi:hypothetical protein FACS1894204_02260 [Synergistales bacterium]|nr:hypothetical protein FACS1894204_02260 [Synergistales bacterium]
MQDMFPFPVTVSGNVSASAKGAKTKRPDANKFDAKKPNAAGDGARRNDVKNAKDSARQPFESVLNQAEGAELAAKPEKGTRQIEASPLDTQSAASFRDENQPLDAEKAEVSDILNAIGNLLSPLSANQGGVDPSFISDEVSIALGELLTAIPGSENGLGGGSDVYQQNTELLNGNDLDVARLESMLALMKNRAPADTPDAPAPAGDSPRSLDRAAIIDLTASFLQNLQAKATERKHGDGFIKFNFTEPRSSSARLGAFRPV